MFTTAPEPAERVLSNDEALNELSRKLENMLKYHYKFEHRVYDFPL